MTPRSRTEVENTCAKIGNTKEKAARSSLSTGCCVDKKPICKPVMKKVKIIMGFEIPDHRFKLMGWVGREATAENWCPIKIHVIGALTLAKPWLHIEYIHFLLKPV